MAIVAFSIDSMLPALPEIAEAFSPDDVNRAQLVLASFVMGLGIGTLTVGPLSDAFGRKRIILFGIGIYVVGAILALVSNSMEMLLIARLIQGIGAAGPRVVSIALVRDLYHGREMARLTSFVMMIFVLVPALAPAMGAGVIALFGWRGIFATFVIFALIALAWFYIRQDETLAPENRRHVSVTDIRSGIIDAFSRPSVRIYCAVLTLGFGQMFAVISSAQQIYTETFGIEDFIYWFAGSAVISGLGTLANATFVVRFGMRRIAILAYGSQMVFSAIVLLLDVTNALPAAYAFPLFFIWISSIFFMAGVTFGNLIALALEELGHIAGLASSLVQGIATICAALIAAPVGLAFNGTIVPLVFGAMVCSGLAFFMLRKTLHLEFAEA